MPAIHAPDSIAIALVCIKVFVLFTHTPLAAAHGYVQTVVTADTAYPGWNPFSDPYMEPTPERVVRKIPSDGPITDDQDQDLACNVGGESGAALVASAPAGSVVKFEWTNVNPLYFLFYFFTDTHACVSGCSGQQIDADGYSNGSWASAKLISNNNTWSSKIPSALASGQYLMRNEIVALHSTGAPQYYPSCTQVGVSGDGSSLPSSDETVKIPGLYDDVDFPDIWSETFDVWAAPGPAVVSFADSSDGQNSTPSDDGSGDSPRQCRLIDQSSDSRFSRRSLTTRFSRLAQDIPFVLQHIRSPIV
ncbi:hypothetical protein ACEPAF_7441 [Sanghuangporus sanghuang]|uniref:lytic cellulose monooxygenase (C4-dehydrogenating) n=1 Tax=Sanghuangporus baumii TaxID=108892 RepID=A0A9Q5HVN0_SANBA|nr:hypothetical protein A7U60_g6034 [Sanghuangporus baumii]